MLQNLHSAAVVIGALRVKSFLIEHMIQNVSSTVKIFWSDLNICIICNGQTTFSRQKNGMNKG